ncbi:MAG: hypothetical protein AB7U62_11345 [Pseudolabrys sp.]
MTDAAARVRDPKWDGVASFIDSLREAAFTAIRARSPMKVEWDPFMAFTICDALQHWMDHKMPLYRGMVELEENVLFAANVAEDVMRDNAARFALMLGDLEDVLEKFVGRQPSAMADIRSAKPPPRRHVGKYQISDELRLRIAKGEIGTPRPEGWDEELEGPSKP